MSSEKASRVKLRGHNKEHIFAGLINKCPYELATDLKLSSNNKWLELIQISKR